jgi:hypothetical protein
MADTSFSWPSALAGLGFSVIGGLVTAYVQYHYTRQQQQAQLFLDEKREFISACDNYLKQYGTWYRLTRYYAFQDSLKNDKWLLLDSIPAERAYVRFGRNFDYAYGKIFLVSDNDFGLITFQVSTVLSNTLNTIMTNDSLTSKAKVRIFYRANEYFFEHWMVRAQREIFRYNSGERLQKTLRQAVVEFNDSVNLVKQDSIAVEGMYKSLEQVQRYKERQDSLSGKDYKRPGSPRMPTRKEFREFVRPGKPD